MSDHAKTEGTAEKISDVAGIMEQNIKKLTKLRQQEEREKTSGEHIADKISGFTGSMSFVYVHVILYGLWFMWNIGLLGFKPIDPSLADLSVLASVEAIFLSTFVLMSQKRLNELSNKRANLDLHVSLLAEHEITRLLTLVTAIANKLKVEEGNNPEMKELAQDVNLEQVLDTIDKHKQEIMEKEGIKF